MRLLSRFSLLLLFLGFSAALFALQRDQYQGFGRNQYSYEGDPNEKAEFPVAP